MPDLKDTSQITGLMSAVKDIMMKNQNLYQKDLEAKYAPQQHATPAEVEAVTQDNTVEVPEPVPVEPAPEPQAEPAPVADKIPESRLRRTMRTGMRWLLGFLIVFGLGAVVVAFTFYLPARREIQRAGEAKQELESKYQAEAEQVEQLSAELERSKSRISSLAVSRYSPTLSP